jgi:hypothetical protein
MTVNIETWEREDSTSANDSSTYTPQVDDETCQLRLHAPLSANVAIYILKTPIPRPLLSHNVCTARERAATSSFGEGRPVVTQAIPLYRQCLIEKAKPKVRPVEAVQRVFLENNAYLHSGSPSHLRNIGTDLILCGAEVHIRSEKRNHLGLMDTAIELLKLASKHPRQTYLADVQTEVMAAEQGRFGCTYAKRHVYYQLFFQMTHYYVPLFVEKVSRNDLPYVFCADLRT